MSKAGTRGDYQGDEARSSALDGALGTAEHTGMH